MAKNHTSAPIVVPPSQRWDGNDGPWSTFSLQVGTPPQPVNLLVSTTAGETWVISANSTQGGCLKNDPSNCAESRGVLYNINASTTWQDQGIFALGDEVNLPDYIGNYDNGDYGLENLGLGTPGSGGVVLSNQVVAGLATKDFYVGNFGVTSRPTNFTAFNDPHTSFLSSLQQQGHIPSLSFGYTAGNQYRLKKVLGSLTLGGYDQSKFTPNGQSFDFATDISRDLVVGLQSIQYNDASSSNTPLLSTGILTFVDATVPHIWLPKSSCSAFEKAFGIQFNTTIQRYLVNDTLHSQLLARNPSVSFILGNQQSGGPTVNITLPYGAFDLVLGSPFVNGTQRYFPLRQAANDTQYTLGRTFLQEAYLTVDYERSNFSISQARFKDDAASNIVAISSTNTTNGITISHQGKSVSAGAIAGIVVGVIVVLIAAILGFFFLYRRRKRRRLAAEEQRKADEYDPMAKPEMDGESKPMAGELFADNKSYGAEMDSKSRLEMEGSQGGYYNDDKLRAEMEGSKGGLEMEGTKGGHEMQAAEVAAPVEMWAGSHGLYELPSPASNSAQRPSAPSRHLSSTGSTGPSPASPSDGSKRNSLVPSWARRSRLSHNISSQAESDGISSPTTDEPASSRESDSDALKSRRSPQPPPAARLADGGTFTTAHRTRDRARKGEEVTRRLEGHARKTGSKHQSVSSPSSDSGIERRYTPRQHHPVTSNTVHGAASPQPPIISSASSSPHPRQRHFDRDRDLPRTPADSAASSGDEILSAPRGPPRRSAYDSWTSRVSDTSRANANSPAPPVPMPMPMPMPTRLGSEQGQGRGRGRGGQGPAFF